MFKKYKFLITALLCSFLLTGCGSESGFYVEEAAYDSAVSLDGGVSKNLNSIASSSSRFSEDVESTAQNVDTNSYNNSKEETSDIQEVKEDYTERKLIKTVDLSMQTKQFDTFTGQIESIINKYNGYIESSDISGQDYYYANNHRYANYTIRIPAQKLDEFLNNVNDLGVVSSKSENVEDVTLNYYDTEAQKEALEVEQERLMDILSKAETIDQIIALEQRLSEVRYEINSLGSSLRLLDNKVDYSTVYLYLDEVEVEVSPKEEKTVFDSIKENWEMNAVNLKYFFEDLIINLTSNLFVIILEIAVIIILIVFIKKRKNKKKLKHENKQENNKEQ